MLAARCYELRNDKTVSPLQTIPVSARLPGWSSLTYRPVTKVLFRSRDSEAIDPLNQTKIFAHRGIRDLLVCSRRDCREC